MIRYCRTHLVIYIIYNLGFAFTLTQANQQSPQPTTNIEILGQLLKNYSSKTPPLVNDSLPVNVKVNCHIRSIESINEMKMEYSMQIIFRQIWNDPRLSFHRVSNSTENLDGSPFLKKSPISLDSTPRISSWDVVERLWTPDLFFGNEKHAQFHNIMKPNILLEISPSGDILFSSRISLLLGCPMNLRFYPMDKQVNERNYNFF